MRRQIFHYLFIFLVVFSLVSLIVRFGTKPFYQFLGYSPKAGIKVTAIPESRVWLKGNEVGKTPFEDQNLIEGEYELKLVASLGEWQGRVRLNAGTVTVVNRKIGPNPQAGEVLVLYPGKGMVLTSTPSGAEVSLDGQMVGQTPVSLPRVAPGEHDLKFSLEGWLPRPIKATLPANLSLSIQVDLTAEDLAKSPISTPKLVLAQKARVADTPTGFLRIRSQPSVLGAEIGRLAPGDQLVILEEPTLNWSKIRTSTNLEGYVSSQYLEKQP